VGRHEIGEHALKVIAQYIGALLCAWSVFALPCMADSSVATTPANGVPRVVLPVRVERNWPEDIPCLPGYLQREASVSPNHFMGNVESMGALEEVFAFYVDEVERLGWIRDAGEIRVEESGHFSFSGCLKETSRFSVQGGPTTEGGRIVAVSIRVVDEDAACPGTALPLDPEAQAILQKMRATYAAVKSYTDTGASVTEFNFFDARGRTQESMESQFTIAYVAPDRLRIECGAEYPFILHCDGGEIRSFSGDNGAVESVRSLQEGIGLAARYSRDAVRDVADLLRLRVLEVELMNNPQVIGREVLDGVACHVIEYTDVQCLPGRIWVAVEESTLRCTESYSHKWAGVWHQVTTHNPVLNPLVPEAQLAFTTAGKLILPAGPGLAQRTARTFADVFDYWF